MIIGTGVDICEVPRIAESIARFGDRFLHRVFTEREIRYCRSKKNSVERFAARFAAKEAAMKALGTGASRGVTWKSIEVGHAPGGRPILHLAGFPFPNSQRKHRDGDGDFRRLGLDTGQPLRFSEPALAAVRGVLRRSPAAPSSEKSMLPTIWSRRKLVEPLEVRVPATIPITSPL